MRSVPQLHEIKACYAVFVQGEKYLRIKLL